MSGGMIWNGPAWAGRAAAVAALGLLAGCGSASNEGPGLAASVRQAATQIAAERLGGRKAAPAPAPDPQAMAAEALRVNPGPLILVGLEGPGTMQVLAMTGENQGKRTYMTEAMQSFVMRDGMVLGTKGLGNDLNVAEVGTEGLIRARRSGTGIRLMHALQGDGREHTLQLQCTVTPEASRVVEDCRAGALRVQNTYVVGAGGSLPVSRQWLGQGLGYATVQVVRP